MKQILFLKPILKESIWGGTRLAEFGYDLPSDHVGECWGISAHPNGCSSVVGGAYDGRRLDDLWREESALFGRSSSADERPDNWEAEMTMRYGFPLLIKLIDAQDDLSIQVHPDDAYALANENGALGKTECWYVLKAEEGAEIVIGHHAKTKDELERMVREGRMRELIREIPVKAGDFFQIEPGTIHAIKKGTMLLETQENSDITYRLYDYDRLQNGKKRPLHIEQSLAVIKVPYVDNPAEPQVKKVPGAVITRFVTCTFYTVYLTEIDGTAKIPLSGMFHTMSVIEGEGFLDGSKVRKGDHLILSAGYGEACAVGHFTAVVTRV